MIYLVIITYILGFIVTLVYYVFLKNGNNKLSLKSVLTFILLWVVSPLTLLVIFFGMISITIKMIIHGTDR